MFDKPTSTEYLIQFNSNHPFNQRVAFLKSFLHFLNSIPINLNIELSWIKTTAKSYNFPDFVVDKIHYYHFNKLVNQNLIIPDQDAGFCSIPQFSLIFRDLVYYPAAKCRATYIGQTGQGSFPPEFINTLKKPISITTYIKSNIFTLTSTLSALNKNSGFYTFVRTECFVFSFLTFWRFLNSIKAQRVNHSATTFFRSLNL